ncbi:MAG TPA: CoA-binding protein [Ignavibacteriaceae bacterium]|nr:CoA-binding protein [Ignavibacteriaceae bacterium]
MTSKALVEEFLHESKIALVGISRDKRKFGNTIYRELKKKGFALFPVNPNMTEFEEDKCYSSLSSLQQRVDALIINIPPKNTKAIVEEAKNVGIKKIWMQQGSESTEAIKFCNENNIEIISGECILMFAEPAAFFHRAHRWINKIAGELPA